MARSELPSNKTASSPVPKTLSNPLVLPANPTSYVECPSATPGLTPALCQEARSQSEPLVINASLFPAAASCGDIRREDGEGCGGATCHPGHAFVRGLTVFM